MSDKYFRSTIVSSNPSTEVYWAENDKGDTRDIVEADVPVGATVNDLTHDHVEITRHIKTKNGYKRSLEDKG